MQVSLTLRTKIHIHLQIIESDCVSPKLRQERSDRGRNGNQLVQGENGGVCTARLGLELGSQGNGVFW